MADYQRIEQLLKHLNMSARALALALGLKNPQIFYDIKAEKCGISKELATKIQERYLNVSAAWLLTGEGQMLKESTTNVGEISGSGNTVGMTVSQTIKRNSGQNAGRDIHNPPCLYGDKHFMAELEAQRKLAERQLEVYSASLSQRDEQIRTAQSQIDTLIKQNQEQFNRFMALLEMMQNKTV